MPDRASCWQCALIPETPPELLSRGNQDFFPGEIQSSPAQSGGLADWEESARDRTASATTDRAQSWYRRDSQERRSDRTRLDDIRTIRSSRLSRRNSAGAAAGRSRYAWPQTNC